MVRYARSSVIGLAIIFTACSAPIGRITPGIPQITQSYTSQAFPETAVYAAANLVRATSSSVSSSTVPLPSPKTTAIHIPIPPTPTLPPELSALRIVFTHEQKLWVWQNHTSTSLTNLDGPAQINISDDGDVIAFQWNGLWVINSDGANERQLVSLDDLPSMEPREPGVKLNQFDWIPGTDRLLFNTRIVQDYGVYFTDDLYRVNTETAQWQRFRPPDEGGRFLISPDGEWAVMVTPAKISLMAVDGSSYQTLLEYPHVAIPSEVEFYADPIWANDSLSLLVAIPPQDVYYESTTPTSIWCLDIDGKPPKVVSQILPVDVAYISPDLSKVIALRLVGQDQANSIFEMHIANIDGSGDRIFRTGIMYFQNWAPDSEHFVVWLNDPQGYHLGEADGELIRLTEPSFIRGSFSWIDESHFLYLGGQHGLCELRLGTIGKPSILIAAAETNDSCIDYDFVRLTTEMTPD
jgi:hypothetical protein